MSSNMINRALTRRQFLKTAAGTAALVAVSDKLLTGKSTLMPNPALAGAPKEDGWYPGSCFMCTQSDCLTRVHVVDGVVVQVEGNPKSITNEGTLCPRGNSVIMNLYNPWRVKAPMKRTNPKKGLEEDPKWVEISWDEALNTVADKLKKVKADDPRKISYCNGFGLRSAGRFQLSWLWAAIGTPNKLDSSGSACAYHIGSEYVHSQHPDTIVDMDRCEYVINIGRTMGPNFTVASSGTRTLLDALERGMKIINVDPRCGPEASKATEWVPIQGGTDLALMLGMLNTMFYEIGNDKLDIWFVKNRTNGTYLIGPDGYYVRDPASKKPLLWDEKEKRARAFDDIPPMNAALDGTYTVNSVQCSPSFKLIKDAMKEYTPEWAEKQCTVPAAKIRELANDFVSHAKIGSTITIDGFTFPFRPVALNYERGPYAHTVCGPAGDFVGKIICELVGNIDVPGGITGNRMPGKEILAPAADGMLNLYSEASGAGREWSWPPNAVDSRQFYPMHHKLFIVGAKGMLYPEEYHIPYKTEILCHCGGNPLGTSFARKEYEKTFSTVPFVFSFAFTYDEPVILSDILLPDDSFMLKPLHGTSAQPHKVMDDKTRGSTLFYYRDVSKITRPYNTRSVHDVAYQLAERMGLLFGKGNMVDRANAMITDAKYKLDINKGFTNLQFAEAYLKSTFGDDWTLDKITADVAPPTKFDTRGAKNYNYYYWPDNKVRHPMYLMQFKVMGDKLQENFKKAGITKVPGWRDEDMQYYWKAYAAIPTWTQKISANPPPGFDLWAMTWKTYTGFNVGDQAANVLLHETTSTWDPYEYAVIMNAKTAEKKGLKEGDTVIVESKYGKTQGRLKTTQLIHPDMVGFPGNHGHGSKWTNPTSADGPSFNVLCSSEEKDLGVDPITGGIDQGPAVKVTKA